VRTALAVLALAAFACCQPYFYPAGGVGIPALPACQLPPFYGQTSAVDCLAAGLMDIPGVGGQCIVARVRWEVWNPYGLPPPQTWTMTTVVVQVAEAMTPVSMPSPIGALFALPDPVYLWFLVGGPEAWVPTFQGYETEIGGFPLWAGPILYQLPGGLDLVFQALVVHDGPSGAVGYLSNEATYSG
jgi:hypothetical protein